MTAPTAASPQVSDETPYPVVTQRVSWFPAKVVSLYVRASELGMYWHLLDGSWHALTVSPDTGETLLTEHPTEAAARLTILSRWGLN